ncbi:phosphatase PAP2 family protein [Streptacidiphilus sp. N1-3]|uniref:Phosphatase PAP2 family protein n=1 Tax=Streptacidiphilus alkalitolerans TaxID=3342712 RepID=A0ABV6WUU1_9ACTN
MGEPKRDHKGVTTAAAVRPSDDIAPDGTTAGTGTGPEGGPVGGSTGSRTGGSGVGSVVGSVAGAAAGTAAGAASGPAITPVTDPAQASPEWRSPWWQRSWNSLLGHFRSPGRPRLWFELLLIAVSYWLYSLVRNAVPEMQNEAERNAHNVWHFEQTLGFAWERSINHSVDSVTWLITGMNYYYATLHFIMTIGVLVWLFRRQPGRYAAARLSLFVTTAIALFGYYFYPLAPPRLMDGGDFIDTVAKHHTWGSMASGDMASVSNQFAAMPSMHIGWSLWCGLTIAFLARRRWVRVLGLMYPLATLVVIVASANHFFMDAVLGACCTGVGLLASRLVYGRWVFAFPRDAAPSSRPSSADDDTTPTREPVAAGR